MSFPDRLTLKISKINELSTDLNNDIRDRENQNDLFHGITVKGIVSSEEDLPTENNTIGDTYFTNSTNFTTYIWDGTVWTDCGNAKGGMLDTTLIYGAETEHFFLIGLNKR